jgi:RNA polymerase sigma-70 factor (ECF subfamily)
VQGARPLATAFASARPEVAADEALEHALARMLAEGREAWPGLTVEDAAFARHVAARAPAGGEARLAELHAADLFLACACAASDARAIEAFDRRYLSELPALLARSGVPHADAEDATQALRARLFTAPKGARAAKILEYSGRGSLAGWLRVAGTRLAANARRTVTRAARRAAEAAPPPGLSTVDPELLAVRRRYGPAFDAAIREGFAALSAEERTVLRLYFVDGLNIDRIGVALGLSRATVGRRMIAARACVLDTTLRVLGERLGATTTELESLLTVIRSTLELSLGGLIAMGEAPAGET